jgi:hypothetical protein
MRHWKIIPLAAASLVVTALLGVSGCGDEHHDRYYGNREHEEVRYDRGDNDRHEERHEAEHHEDRGGNEGHENEHHD